MGILVVQLVLVAVCVFVGARAQCLTDLELAKIQTAGKVALQKLAYNVTTGGLAGPFDFSFAPANYTGSGVNPSSRYIVPRLGPWREGDIGGDSFLNWGIGEVDTLTSRQALVVVMCTPPNVHFWSLEAAVLYRLGVAVVRTCPAFHFINSRMLLELSAHQLMR